MPGADLHQLGSAAALGSPARGRAVGGTGACAAFNDRPSGGRGAVGHYAQTMHGPTREALGDVSALALLLVHGISLWIIIPIGFTLWLLALSWTARLGLGEFLGWLDLNLIAALHRAMVRPFNGSRVEFVPARLIQTVIHRIHVVDPI